MKKVLSLIIIFMIFILIYFLQSNFFIWFNIDNIKPNLFIILSVIIGIYLGKTYGATIGIVCGLLLDMFIGKKLGINAIVLGSVGLLGGIFTKKFSKDSRLTITLMSCLATLIGELISYIIQMIAYNFTIEILAFLKIIAIEILFNAMIVIIMYPIIEKAGNKLEKIFKEDKILTRYY